MIYLKIQFVRSVMGSIYYLQHGANKTVHSHYLYSIIKIYMSFWDEYRTYIWSQDNIKLYAAKTYSD
jgi:hypothetical protein